MSALGESGRASVRSITLSPSIEATEFFAPIIPAMSSLRFRHAISGVELADGRFGFGLTYWYFSATPYLYFEPFVEIGAMLSIVDLARSNSYWSASAGFAVEYFDLGLAVPATVAGEWHAAIGTSGVWVGVQGQALFWSDGVGIEIAAPVQYQGFTRVYASLGPQAIAYFVDDRINLNLRTALTVGVRLGGGDDA